MKNQSSNIIKMLIFCLALSFCTLPSRSTFAFSTELRVELDLAIDNLAMILQEKVAEPKVESIGGEWTVIALARSGADVPQSYFDAYYNTLERYIQLRDGVLHEKKYSEYSRVVLALTALGYNPSAVSGYDVLQPLSDFSATIFQGVNGAMWALIALDSGADAFLESSVGLRQSYLDYILSHQLADGGFGISVSSTQSDIDMTGMALQAVANDKTTPSVATACDVAVAYLSNIQGDDGGFMGLESTIQVMLGLLAMDISLEDARFVKNGNSIVSYVMSHYIADVGFVRTLGDSTMNLMATEQGLLGLSAIQRQLDGKTKLYDMRDVLAMLLVVESGIVKSEIVESEIIELENIELENIELENIELENIELEAVQNEHTTDRVVGDGSACTTFFWYANSDSASSAVRNDGIIGLWAFAISLS